MRNPTTLLVLPSAIRPMAIILLALPLFGFACGQRGDVQDSAAKPPPPTTSRATPGDRGPWEPLPPIPDEREGPSSPIPEPSAAVLFGLGGLMFAIGLRERRRRAERGDDPS